MFKSTERKLKSKILKNEIRHQRIMYFWWLYELKDEPEPFIRDTLAEDMNHICERIRKNKRELARRWKRKK